MMAEHGRPFEPEGLDHVTLLVDDLAKATAFYVDVLGCQPLDTSPAYGMARLRCGAALIAMVDISKEEGKWARSDVSGGRNMDHVCLALTDFEPDDMRRYLASHGVEIVEESHHGGARGQSLSFYVRDPSGNMLELKGPPRPRREGP